MKLLIIRHGDQNYSIDSLTEKGWREAEYLSERLSGMDIKKFYVSSMGRAKDTASFTLKKMGRSAEECEWLREFAPLICHPGEKEEKIVWDWLPQDWTKEERFYQKDHWFEPELLREAKVREEYEWVTGELDCILERHGYVREGNYYRVREANTDTIVFFCHFGLGCVLLSHLLGISPMVLWHGFCAAPTSIAEVVTEERRKGIASFRMRAYGDTSHLYVKGEEPSNSARFCECYDNAQERHD